MMRWVVLLLAALLLLVACSGESENPSASVDAEVSVSTPFFYVGIDDPEQVAVGESIYATHCTECHGERGEGQFPDDPFAPDETGLIGAPPHDDSGHTWQHDDVILLQTIHDGGIGDRMLFYEMPAFGDTLTNEEIEAVLAYIKTLWSDGNRDAQRRITQAAQSAGS